MAWDTTEETPALLSDGTNSYIYGPEGLPIEQIQGKGEVLYLHHDQQGSTRMLTGSAGKDEGATTYDAYGNVVKTTGTATTPLGYDGQYTSADTGLIYLKARSYEPKTAQFLSVDPAEAETGEPYSFAGDDPVNAGDPNGEQEQPLPLPPPDTYRFFPSAYYGLPAVGRPLPFDLANPLAGVPTFQLPGFGCASTYGVFPDLSPSMQPRVAWTEADTRAIVSATLNAPRAVVFNPSDNNATMYAQFAHVPQVSGFAGVATPNYVVGGSGVSLGTYTAPSGGFTADFGLVSRGAAANINTPNFTIGIGTGIEHPDLFYLLQGHHSVDDATRHLGPWIRGEIRY